MVTENFDKVYDAFAKKDYFGTTSRIKTMIGNWKRAIEKGDEGAKQYTEKDIIDSMEATSKLEATIAYEKLKKAIEKKDINFLKSILRHDQKFSQALFMDITGKRLPKTTKEIQSFLDDMFKNESVNEQSVKPKINRRGDSDGLLVTYDGVEYHVAYPADGYDTPYGIAKAGDDEFMMIGKNKDANNLWKKLKPLVDKFKKSKSNESLKESPTSVKGKFSKEHLAKLKAEYDSLDKINPSSPSYDKLIKLLNIMDKNQLKQLSDANIKFVSMLARNRYQRK
jgi:hypothetical protein